MKRQNKIIGAIVGIVLLAGIIGFNLQSGSTEVIVIGAPLPLTGNSASLAERVKITMELGLKDASIGAKHKYKLQFEDDKADSQTAISAVHKLIDVDKSKILVGFLKSDPLLAVAPITEKNKVILISPTAGADKISEAGDYIFRTIEKSNVHGETMTEFLKKKGVTNVAIFTADASNAKSYSNAFKIAFGNAGGNIKLETSYKPDATDFRTDIAKVKADGVQAIYIGVATAKDGGLLVKQLREQGFTGIIAASVAAEAQEFFDTAGALGEGTYITASYYDKDDSKYQNFRSEFKKLYNNKEADGFSANGYDSVRLAIAASEACDGVSNTDCLRDYLYNIKDYAGIGGTLSFDKNGDVIKPVLIKMAKNGAFGVVR